MIDAANQNSPDGSRQLEHTVLNTEKRRKLGIFRKVTTEVQSSADSPLVRCEYSRELSEGQDDEQNLDARSGLDHNSLLEQIGLLPTNRN